MSGGLPQVSVALVLPAGDGLTPWLARGAARLVELLHGDPRLALTCRVAAAPGDRAVPRLLAAVLAAEGAVFARDRPPSDPPWASVPVRTPDEMPPVDVVVDLACGPEIEALAGRARHGLWRLSTAEPRAGIAEAMRAAPVSPVELSRLSEPGGAWQVIGRARYDTKFLATRNRAFQAEKAAQLVEQALARLAANQPLVPAVDAPSPAALRLGDLPGYLARATGGLARRGTDKLREKVGGRPGRFCLRLARGTALDFDPGQGVELDAPEGRYWADPFLFEEAGATYLFFEEYVYATGLGHLSVGRLDGERLDYLGPVLETGAHLSFPFVFRHEGEIYMMPETGAAGRLEIWRATGFPMQWTLHATALDGVACADSVLFEERGNWWLFTNICRDSAADFCSELHLFTVDGPDLGRVEPHPLNPVVIGSDVARGAGRIRREGGRLLRPSQDNSHGSYGYGLNLMEIERLSPTDYQERRVRHLPAADLPGLIGCHHVDVLGDRVVWDVRKR